MRCVLVGSIGSIDQSIFPRRLLENTHSIDRPIAQSHHIRAYARPPPTTHRAANNSNNNNHNNNNHNHNHNHNHNNNNNKSQPRVPGRPGTFKVP